LAPLALDVLDEPWPEIPGSLSAIVNINMIHIAPWAATLGLLRHAAAAVAPGGALILYGPYLREGVETAEGNRAFDADLRARNPEWGIRRLEDVAAAAAPHFGLERVVEMPANNLVVVFRREGA
jgi:hypothetical protein